MEHRDDTRPQATGRHPSGTAAAAYDRAWAGEVRGAVRYATALLGLLLCLDGAATR
ncbi:hypothetical protein ACFQ3Z_09850 [Streptomyces nogalater]